MLQGLGRRHVDLVGQLDGERHLVRHQGDDGHASQQQDDGERIDEDAEEREPALAAVGGGDAFAAAAGRRDMLVEQVLGRLGLEGEQVLDFGRRRRRHLAIFLTFASGMRNEWPHFLHLVFLPAKSFGT